MSPHQLLEAAVRVYNRDPRVVLERNRVGNLAVLSPDGEYLGYVDLGDGTVAWAEDAEWGGDDAGLAEHRRNEQPVDDAG